MDFIEQNLQHRVVNQPRVVNQSIADVAGLVAFRFLVNGMVEEFAPIWGRGTH
jgi:hypothetical protein